MNKKKIVITGVTGFIGSALAAGLKARGYEAVGISRKPGMAADGMRLADWESGLAAEIEGAKALINLAGDNIAAGLWTKKKKDSILKSRVSAAQKCAAAIAAAEEPPEVFIQGSATGYYGDRKDETLDEGSAPGSGFLASVCVEWEKASVLPGGIKTRHVIARTGIVLGKGSFLSKIKIPFMMFLGGPIGDGRQYMPWIHIDDLVEACVYIIENKGAHGVYNITSPSPVTNLEFSKALAAAMNRPCWLPVPAFILRFALGEMADNMILSSTRAVPERLAAEGFVFQYDDIGKALDDLP